MYEGNHLCTCSNFQRNLDYEQPVTMCNDKNLSIPQQVTLGDGRSLQGPAEGTVRLHTILPGGSIQECRLENVVCPKVVQFTKCVESI